MTGNTVGRTSAQTNIFISTILTKYKKRRNSKNEKHHLKIERVVSSSRFRVNTPLSSLASVAESPGYRRRRRLNKALSTRIRFHLKTQLFLYGYGFRPQVSDENDH